MKTLNTILLATDFGVCSDAATSTALELALGLDATVHALHVFTLQDNLQTANFSQVELSALQKQAKEKFEALARTREGASRLGRVISQFGDPAERVLLTADELHADLIVLGSHGRHGIARGLLGSVAETVVRDAKCPVLVAKCTTPRVERLLTVEPKAIW
jgi:nucleotide-binding universal stress UspA family protein